jgi:DNA polymerase III subunit epsilon
MFSWLKQITGAVEPVAGLDDDARTAIERWQRVLVDTSRDVHETRFVVADVESSGLNPRKDALIAIGAVVVQGGQIRLGESFEMVIQQAAPSSDANILIHRISSEDQLNGAPAVDVLTAFLEFVGTSPLVGFHAAFDAAMLDRAYRKSLGIAFDREWLDLAWLAPALKGEGASHARRSLDDWLNTLGIEIMARHNAAADALGTAQLLQALFPLAKKRGLVTPEDFIDEARSMEHMARAHRGGM